MDLAGVGLLGVRRQDGEPEQPDHQSARQAIGWATRPDRSSSKAAQRFGGGNTKNLQPRRYGTLKAVDPTTGEIKASVKMTYPNYGGVLATAGNLVFIGQLDGTLYAYDARTLKEVWSFNAGTGINAPPITYSINGKQYIAVLMGSKQTAAVWEDSPELKNTSTASMLYVFAL